MAVYGWRWDERMTVNGTWVGWPRPHQHLCKSQQAHSGKSRKLHTCTYMNELYLCHTAVYVTDRRPPGSWKPANKRCPIILVILVAKMALSSHIIILYGMLKGYDPIQSITALTLGPIYRLSITFFDKFPKKPGFAARWLSEWKKWTMNIFYNLRCWTSIAAQHCALFSGTISYSSGIWNTLFLVFRTVLSIEFIGWKWMHIIWYQ